MPLRSGDALGRYVIDGVLGHGGMGSVYRAHDTRLHRRVALKVLSGEASAAGTEPSAGRPGRILREARIAAKLEHPNVVAIYDVDEITEGELAGTAYLAMELVEGRSLRACAGDRAIPLATRLRWLTDVARGLAAAHDRGLVHRDVKPENVVVRADGVAKVLDFGIAKQVTPQLDAFDLHTPPDSDSVTKDGALAIVMPVSPPEPGSSPAQISPHAASITGEGIVVGTPYYMSPEQMKGAKVDARTDQFSWGVVAYELLCGSPPWGAHAATVHIVAAILGTEPADPSTVNAEIPAWLGAIVRRAMAKSADARFPSMHDLVAKLERGEAGAETLEPSPPKATGARLTRGARSRGRLLLAGAGVVLLAAGVAGALRKAVRSEPSSAAPSASVASARAGCASNAECTKTAGEPAVCANGRCVPLASPDCRVAADPAALAGEDTLWIGSLYPETGSAAAMGQMNARATELARQDFAQAAALSAGGDRVRPIGLLACDDGADAKRAARHLVEDVGVPAIVGFLSGDEVLALSGSLLGPHHTLAIATLTTSPLVTQIPHGAGEPPLVWRTSYSLAEDAVALAALLHDVLEPQLRAAGAPKTKVALLRLKSSTHLAFSEHLFDALSFNGKSALDNGNDYREFIVEWNATTPETYASIVSRLRDFEPGIVFYTGPPFIENVLAPLEKAWPAKARVRPRYVSDAVFDDQLSTLVGTDAELRKRMYGVTLPSTTPANARFTLHYNGVYGTELSRADAPSTAYDGFYVAAYAALALGSAPATGPSLAMAIDRLLPPGVPVEVGPSGIYAAFTHLRGGEPIDLAGAGGPLDLNPQTGENETDLSILCLDVDKRGKAIGSLESGLVYSAKTRALVGKMRCP